MRNDCKHTKHPCKVRLSWKIYGKVTWTFKSSSPILQWTLENKYGYGNHHRSEPCKVASVGLKLSKRKNNQHESPTKKGENIVMHILYMWFIYHTQAIDWLRWLFLMVKISLSDAIHGHHRRHHTDSLMDNGRIGGWCGFPVELPDTMRDPLSNPEIPKVRPWTTGTSERKLENFTKKCPFWLCDRSKSYDNFTPL